MKLTLVRHQYFKMHDPSPHYHPENPERLSRVERGLRAYNLLESLDKARITPGNPMIYREVHDEAYLREILDEAEYAFGAFFIDPDTYMSPGTMNALEALAGSVNYTLDVIDEASVIILGRPPGHHAGRSGVALGAPTQGFCLVNTVALLAYKLARRGRVLVVDFDVHHGNGTQEILGSLGKVKHVDIHQEYTTIYPWTGAPGLVGEGNLYNINLPPGSGDDVYLDALKLLAYAVEDHDPDYIVVSAGFDSYNGDNSFSNIKATSATFNTIGKMIASKVQRVVAFLEGGYGVGLERGVPAFIQGLLGKDHPVGENPTKTPPSLWSLYRERLKEVMEAHGINLKV
ncbi:MAG: histone deacetylase family protein [Desulfurococcales archaeon]|nr:histone deacetylase family protein [Desulfurococcales archaeon]